MRILALIIVSLFLISCGDDTSTALEAGVDAAITETSTLEATVPTEVSVDTTTATDAVVTDSSVTID